MNSLTRKSLTGLLELEIFMALLLFLPAGSLTFWQAWIYWFLFSIAVIAITVYLLKNDPHLIQGRLVAGPRGEHEVGQKIIQTIAAVLFAAVLVVPALDFRFRWSPLPAAAVALGDFLLMLSFVMIFFVFRENSFAAATITVEAEQKVISTGPYRLIRHPMYSAALILFLATPLALASAWSLLIVIPLAGILVARLTQEERYLSAHLPGYDAYRQRVNYRLVPMVW